MLVMLPPRNRLILVEALPTQKCSSQQTCLATGLFFLAERPDELHHVFHIRIADLALERGHLIFALQYDVSHFRVRFLLHVLGTEVPRLHGLARGRIAASVRRMTAGAFRLAHLLAVALRLCRRCGHEPESGRDDQYYDHSPFLIRFLL